MADNGVRFMPRHGRQRSPQREFFDFTRYNPKGVGNERQNSEYEKKLKISDLLKGISSFRIFAHPTQERAIRVIALSI